MTEQVKKIFQQFNVEIFSYKKPHFSKKKKLLLKNFSFGTKTLKKSIISKKKFSSNGLAFFEMDFL